MLIALAQLRLRAQFEAEDPAALQVRMWLYPYGTWSAIGGMAAVLVLMGLSKNSMELWASLLVTAAFLGSYLLKARLSRAGNAD